MGIFQSTYSKNCKIENIQDISELIEQICKNPMVSQLTGIKHQDFWYVLVRTAPGTKNTIVCHNSDVADIPKITKWRNFKSSTFPTNTWGKLFIKTRIFDHLHTLSKKLTKKMDCLKFYLCFFLLALASSISRFISNRFLVL